MKQVGDVFYGHTLLSCCGGGAFGEVWYCQDISGRKLALKIISKKKLGEPWKKELKGVQNYRRITGKHPGLLQIFYVGEDEETFYYTMEPADNAGTEAYQPDTLARRLQKGALSPEEYPEILNKIFQGIKAIHEEGFTHRDIKPDNILFVEGEPKLADIGLMVSMTVTVTQLAGTLDYLPPELLTGDSNYDKKTCQRSDFYAFGKVIYCTVTGRMPNEFPSMRQKINGGIAEKYFFNLCVRLCNKDRSLRITKMKDLTREMAEIAKVLQYGETSWGKFRFFLQRAEEYLKSSWSKRKPYYISCLLLLVFGGLWGYDHLKNKDRKVETETKVIEAKQNNGPENETNDKSELDETTKQLIAKAESGDVNAQTELGKLYLRGDKIRKDEKKAFELFKKAAEKGHAVAQFELGLCYAKGEGVKKDYLEAVNWLSKAAGQGYAEAKVWLVKLNNIKEDVKKNFSEATEWFRKVTGQNHKQAKEELQKLEKQKIDKLKEESDKAPDGMREFLFGGGRYSFFIPNQWSVFDRNAIDDYIRKNKNFSERQNNIRIRKNRHVWAVFLLKNEKGKSLNARAELSIYPLTPDQVETFSDQRIAAQFGNDLRGPRVKRYKPFRKLGSLIFLIGRTEKGEACEVYLLPRKKHCIKLTLTKGAGASRVYLFELLETFREKDAAVQKQKGDSRTPLMLALWDRDFTLADKLLKEGADINGTAYSGSTALHLAAEENQTEAVRFLLNRNADPNIQDSGLETPLHFAAQNGNAEILSALLEKKGNPDIQDTLKYTPLCYAVKNSNISCAELLLKAGAKWDIPRNEIFGTPILLHIIIAKNSPELERLLIRYGVPKKTFDLVKEKLKPFLPEK